MYVTIPVLYLSFFHLWLCSFVNLQKGALEGKQSVFSGLQWALMPSEGLSSNFLYSLRVGITDWSLYLIVMENWEWTGHIIVLKLELLWKDSVVTIVCQILSLPSNKGHVVSDNLLAHLEDLLTPSGSICKALGSSCPPYPHIIHVFLWVICNSNPRQTLRLKKIKKQI